MHSALWFRFENKYCIFSPLKTSRDSFKKLCGAKACIHHLYARFGIHKRETGLTMAYVRNLGKQETVKLQKEEKEELLY